MAPSLQPKSRDTESLTRVGKWATAAEVTSIIVQQKQTVETLLTSSTDEDEIVTHKTAKLVQDALLAAMSFAYIGPSRPSCVYTLLRPAYNGPCPFIGCNQTNCPGNRCGWTDSSHTSVKFGPWVHHKNSWRSPNLHLPQVITSELNMLFKYHTKHGFKILTQPFGEERGPYLFVDPANGKPFGESTYPTYFRKLISGWTGGKLQVPPSYLKHIFAEERCSETAVAGPTTQQSAIVMGHTAKQLHNTYDVGKRRRDAQMHVDQLKTWREQLLATPGRPAVPRKQEDATPASEVPRDDPGQQSQHVMLCLTSSDDEDECPAERTTLVKRQKGGDSTLGQGTSTQRDRRDLMYYAMKLCEKGEKERLAQKSVFSQHSSVGI
jgi:hypothetical protein